VNKQQISKEEVKRTSPTKIIIGTVSALALTATLTACAAGNEGNSADGITGTLNGAGSSAQTAAMDAWRKAFQTENSSSTINYDPSGSGAGVEAFLQKAVTFAGSDSPLDPDSDEVSKAQQRCESDPIEVPNYISPIAVVFNVAGVDELNLEPATLAKIFANKITKWNDPQIASSNPGAKLPDAAIRPVHRSDESGTTKNFTDYLQKASAGAWASEADKVWPADLKGEAAGQTSGMVSTVKQTEGSIGYADLSAAKDLSTAKVKVGSEFVAPSAEGAAKALAASKTDTSRGKTDLVVDLDRATTAPGAYPLALVSYLIGCQSTESEQAKLAKEFFTYVISSAGQETAAKSAGSAPLPADLREQAASIVSGMSS